jgi:hypothetical protein
MDIVKRMLLEGSCDQHTANLLKEALLFGINIIPLLEPLCVDFENTPAVKRHLTLCKERVTYYQSIGAIERLGEKPNLIQPLHVVEKEGRKARLVLDLSRNLNGLLEKETFKYQRFDDAVRASTPGCFYGKMDLSDCFLSFPVHPGSRKYLAFELDHEYYRFTRLPFGLSASPAWCERILSVVDFELRSRGIKSIRYVDDFLLIGQTEEETSHAMSVLTSILTRLGLRINNAKTEGPAQKMEFLGIELDSSKQVICVPDKRVHELQSIIGGVLSGSHVTLKQMQSLIGKFSFAAHAIAGARPFFRHLIDSIRGLSGRRTLVFLSTAIRDCLQTWSLVLKEWNGSTAWRTTDEHVIEHDASTRGFGFVLRHWAGPDQGEKPSFLTSPLSAGFSGSFSSSQLTNLAGGETTIQWAELFAIAFSVAMFAPAMTNSALLVRTDNLADVHIINRQSTKSTELLQLLKSIYATCTEHNISIRAEHIRGVDNVMADHLSRPALHKHCTSMLADNQKSIPILFVHSSELHLGKGLKPAELRGNAYLKSV